MMLSAGAGAHEIGAAEQRAHACQQVRQAHVFGHVVVRAHAQARHHVEIAVARGQENHRQRGRQRAQFLAQLEAAVDLVAQADVEQHEVGQARAQRRERRGTVRKCGDFVAVAAEDIGIVRADDRVVFNNGNASAHGSFPYLLREDYTQGGELASASRHLPYFRHN